MGRTHIQRLHNLHSDLYPSANKILSPQSPMWKISKRIKYWLVTIRCSEYYIIWEVSLENNMIFVKDWSSFNLSLHSLYFSNQGHHKVKKHMWKVREVQQIYTKTLMINYIITSLSTLFFTLYYVVILDLHLKGQWFNNLLL